MPSGESLPKWRAFSNSSAAWISAFDGMQPMFEAGAAERFALDQHRGDAELAGANGGDVAAGSAADHQQRRRFRVHQDRFFFSLNRLR